MRLPHGLERWGLLILLSLGWGSAFLFQDEAVREIGPLMLTAARLPAAAAVLLIALWARGERLPRGLRPWMFCAAIGLVGNLLPFTLITWAQDDVRSSVAGILVAVTPMMTLLLAHFTLGTERITVRRTVGFLLALAGVVVLLGPAAEAEFGAGPGALLSYVAVLGGAFCFATGAVIAARMPRLSPMTAAAGVMVAASAFTLPAAVVAGDLPASRPTLDALGSAAVLSLVITPWATYAFFRLVALAGPSFLSLFNYFNPLVAVACGVLVLNEQLPGTAPLALGLILAGVAVAEFRQLVAVVATPPSGTVRGTST